MCRATVTTLTAHREAVLQIVAGLTDDQLRTPVLPSGWTVLGLVEHLAWAMTVWGDGAIRGVELRAPWSVGPGDGPFTSEHPTADVFAFYRDAGDRLAETLDTVPAHERPRGDVPRGLTHLAADVGTVAAHLLEEVARHAGHLDVARELLDGATGLGPR